MKITNKLNLPESIVNATSKDQGSHAPVAHRYSVTELLQPIRQILLTRKQYDNIEEDVADMIPAMFGTAIHQFLESATPFRAGQYTEEKIESKFDEDTLVGQIDFLDIDNRIIRDYKTCSVNKIIKEDFSDWRLQGLMYAALVWKEHDVKIKKLEFIALLKDWSKIRSATSTGYPNSGVYKWEYEIQDSDLDFMINSWIPERLTILNYHLDTDTLPECSDEDRWYTGDKWAVFKKAGDKRAAKVFDTEDDAHAFITSDCGGVGEIQFRKGESTKCKYYCPCHKFCKKGEEE